MPRNWTRASCWIAFLAMTIPAPSAKAADASEKLLPPTTKGFLSITNPQELADQWNKTQLGQLIKDPVIKPFADDLRRQVEDRLSNFREKLGLTLDDLKGVPGGELSVAVIQPAEDQMAVAILVDVTAHREEAKALLEKASENLIQRGAKRTQAMVLETPVDIFDLPKREEGELPEPEGGQARQAVYFLKDNLLGASDSLEVIQGILARAAGQQGDSLADDVPAFRKVMARCGQDAGEHTPQIRWFLEPFGLVKALRSAVPERQRRRGTTMLDHLETTGFTAIEGMGGFVDFAVDGYELLHRTAIYAPKPYQQSMKMLVFPNAGQSEPQPWVPRDIATYTTVYCDILNAFDNFGPLCNAVVGEGEEGDYWNDVLIQLKEDKHGPQIDLREELFRQLDNQVTMITDYQLPISTTSERLLFAVATKDPAAVAKAIEKTLENDDEIRRVQFQGHVIWETVPKEIPQVPRVTIDVDLPALGLEPKEEEEEPQQEDGREGAPLLPTMAVTVAHGHLLVASHSDFLAKVLTPVDEREALGRTVDYLLVEEMIQRAGGGEACLRSFGRTDAEYRPTYELIRRGKMPESETMLGRVLNTLFSVSRKGTIREQKIDGSKLPEFEYVRRHLGPAGMFGTSEDDGWFFTGFTLRKEAE